MSGVSTTGQTGDESVSPLSAAAAAELLRSTAERMHQNACNDFDRAVAEWLACCVITVRGYTDSQVETYGYLALDVARAYNAEEPQLVGTGADAEQARIVAWLRSRGRVTARLGGNSQTLSLAADAIERGEHRAG